VLESRRRMLILLGTSGFIAAAPTLLAQRASPQPIPSPNAPDPHFPPGMNGPGIDPKTGERRANPDDEKEIRKDVDKLYELAAELKNQIEKNNSQLVLSVSFIKNAQQAEKLAKKIKDLSKG
jgi:hypothetical protein